MIAIEHSPNYTCSDNCDVGNHFVVEE